MEYIIFYLHLHFLINTPPLYSKNKCRIPFYLIFKITKTDILSERLNTPVRWPIFYKQKRNNLTTKLTTPYSEMQFKMTFVAWQINILQNFTNLR